MLLLRKAWPFAAFAAVLMVSTSSSIYLVSNFRTLIAAESLWSKGQKDAIYFLTRYADSGEPRYLQQFQAALKIPDADRRARLELEKTTPDYAIAHATLAEGGLHPADIASAAWLLHQFHDASWLQETISYWREGDRYLDQLRQLAREIEYKHTQGQANAKEISTWKRKIRQINEGVAPASRAFSETLAETSRQVTRWLLLLNCALALVFVLLWALLSRSTQQARRRAYAELSEEKERAATTLAAMGDAVITVDGLGMVDYINPAGVGMLGLSEPSAIRNKPLHQVLQFTPANGQPDSEELLRQLLLGGQLHFREEQTRWLRRASFNHLPVKVLGSSLRREGKPAGAVIVLRDASREQQYLDKLSWHATHDNLTGLENRAEFEKRLQKLFDKGLNQQHPAALLYIDLDQFKLINEASGPAAGDAVLCEVCRMLLSKLRQSDTLARLGGDEFGLLLENCPPDAALRIADKLRLAAESLQIRWETKTLRTGLSIGLVNISPEISSAEEILRQADMACYRAKERGRNTIHVYRPEDIQNSRHLGDLEWIACIRSALEQDHFCLYAQSIAALQPSQRKGQHFEVLLRLKGETDQLIMPADFIPAAERYGMMPALDRWVFNKTLATLSARPDVLEGIDTCAVNLSAASLNDENLLNFLQTQMHSYGIEPGIICFEITETGAIANLANATRLIESLRALGCRFALDDFGVGMSSLTYLKQLPVDYVKIDGGFVHDMLRDPSDYAMVEIINRIGHILGKQTIAEFVECKDIAIALQQIGVDYAQGYAVAMPEPLTQEFLSGGTLAQRALDSWQGSLTANP